MRSIYKNIISVKQTFSVIFSGIVLYLSIDYDCKLSLESDTSRMFNGISEIYRVKEKSYCSLTDQLSWRNSARNSIVKRSIKQHR